MSFGKLASVWPLWPFIISPGMAGMLCHWAHKCGLQQTLFITPSQRKWNTKAALAHSQLEGGWGDVFLTQPLPPSLFYYVVFRRGKNNIAMLCGDFGEWEFPAPAVWLQNSKLGLDHFALGRASVQPTNRLCAVTLAQINKSVCLLKSQLAFVWITMWLTRKPCKSPAGMKYIRMTSLHRRRSHPVAARKGIWFICATSARDGRTFPSPNLRPNIILQHPS